MKTKNTTITTMVQRPTLQLPYLLKPEPTQREVEEYVNQGNAATMEDNIHPALAECYHWISKAAPFINAGSITFFTCVWTALIFVVPGLTTLPSMIAVAAYNLVGYGILRWSLKGGYVSLTASLFVGWLLFGGFYNGMNSVFFIFLQLIIAAVAFRKTVIARRNGVDVVSLWRDVQSKHVLAGVASVNDSIRPVWGVAGSHIASNKEMGEAGLKGAEGEGILGAELNRFVAAHPQVRVFHGLCFTPGKKGPDVDHAVLVGDTVILVDAKFWSFASYSWNDNGVMAAVQRDGKYFKGSELNMEAAVRKWRSYLGGEAASVNCLVTMVKEERGYTAKNGTKLSYTVDNTGHPDGVELRTTKQLLRELERLVKNESTPVVNRRLVEKLRLQLQ